MEHSSFCVDGTSFDNPHKRQELSSTHGDPPRRRSYCSSQASSARRLLEAAEQALTQPPTTRCKRSNMRARSLSNSQLTASRSLFAPLPEYAQYQERKTQRALSRRCVFSDTPSSPGLESRQTKIVVTRDLLDGSSRQPASPTKGSDCSGRVRGRPLVSPSIERDDDARREDALVLEVSPGETAVLRSADETVCAIHNGFITPVNCFLCTLSMFCIADAKFVLCPICRVVSPVVTRTGSGLSVCKQKGLGLGFSRDEMIAIRSRKASASS